MSMWDHLTQQKNITVNLLRQSNVHLHLLAWCHYNGAFDYNVTPMIPAGRRVLIYDPVKNRTSWGAHAIEGYYPVPELHHIKTLQLFHLKLERLESAMQLNSAMLLLLQLKLHPKIK